jgi:hypothetical protein
MAQLIVRQIEVNVVRTPKEQAGRCGVALAEERWRILRKALTGGSGNMHFRIQ